MLVGFFVNNLSQRLVPNHGEARTLPGPHLAAEWFAILKFRLELLQGQIMAIAIRRLSESEIPVGKR